MDSEAQYFDKDYVAYKLDISERTLERLMKSGRIRFLRVGRAVRFTPEHLADFNRSNTVALPLPRPPSRGSRS